MAHPKHLVRWRLDFADGSYKAGLWSSPGDHDSAKASKNLRSDLVRASIEAKDFLTREIKILVQCLASDFMEFKWTAVHKVFSNTHEVHGLTLVCKWGSTEILLDGTIIETP